VNGWRCEPCGSMVSADCGICPLCGWDPTPGAESEPLGGTSVLVRRLLENQAAGKDKG
jgi:hypothetical protein